MLLLYKYKPNNEYTMKIFTEGKLYFPSISELNDPFEGAIPFIFDEAELTPENIFQKMYDLATEEHPDFTPEQLYQFVSGNYGKGGFFDEKHLEKINKETRENINEKIGICSLTSKNNNILMWSHYADGHKGLCIGFDWQMLRKSTSAILGNVNYQDDLPKYKIFGSNSDFFQTLLLTKSTEWQYEQEYRLMTIESRGKELPFPFESIVEVIFGCCMLQEERDKYIRLIMEKNRNCKLFETRMHSKQFALEIVSLVDHWIEI
jgi:hypothetical protein